MPANTEAVLRSYRRVLIPEVNLGQLLMLIRARYLIDAVGYDRVALRLLRTEQEQRRRVAEAPREAQAPRAAAAWLVHCLVADGGGEVQVMESEEGILLFGATLPA